MGRPWRVVGADAWRVGAGGGHGGFGRRLDLAADGALSLGPRRLYVGRSSCPSWVKAVWALEPTAIARGVHGLLVAEARGLFREQGPFRERSCCVCGSRGLARQCEHYHLLVPIVQMGRLRPQEAPVQEAGSSFIPGGHGE